MKEYDIAQIAKDVRITIGQNMVTDALSGVSDVGTLSLEEIIRSKIEDAAKFIHMEAGHDLLDGKTLTTKCYDDLDTDEKIAVRLKVDKNSNGTFTCLRLPDDFLRLVSYDETDWYHPVTVAIDNLNPLYAIQRSKYESLRGTPEHPVVAIVHKMGRLYLEAYSNTESGKNETGTNTFTDDTSFNWYCSYIPEPKIVNDKISLCPKLYHAVLYATAYLTELAHGAYNQAMTKLAVAKELAHISSAPTQQVVQQDNNADQ